MALQSSLFNLSLICYTEVVPCKRDLSVGFMCPVVWVSPLEPFSCLLVPGALPTGATFHRRARWVWWWPIVPVCSICLEAKGSRQCSCALCLVIMQVSQSTPIELLPTLSKWKKKGNNGIHWLLWPEELPQLPEGSLCFPAFSILSFSCLLLEAVDSALGCFAGVIATYIYVYLLLLMGVSSFGILLCCHHLGSWDE